jgi:hypothetical protein
VILRACIVPLSGTTGLLYDGVRERTIGFVSLDWRHGHSNWTDHAFIGTASG